MRRPINFEKQEKSEEKKEKEKKRKPDKLPVLLFLLPTAYESFMSAGFSFVSQRLDSAFYGRIIKGTLKRELTEVVCR